jgi:hypothetical protein
MEKIKAKLEYLGQFNLSPDESSDLLMLVKGYKHLLGSMAVLLLGVQGPQVYLVSLQHRKQEIQKVYSVS